VLPEDKCFTPTAAASVQDVAVAITFNKGFLDKQVKPDEVKGLVLHEVLHLTMYHHIRNADQKKEHTLWNVACDLEVNSIISRLNIKLPKGALLPDDYNMPDSYSAEMYYDYIMNNEKLKKQFQGGGSGGKGNGKVKVVILDDHSGWAKSKSEAETQKTITDQVMKGVVKDNMDNIKKSSMRKNLENAIEATKQYKDGGSTKSSMRSGDHGDTLGEFVEEVNSTGEGKMKWRYILNNLIKKTLSKAYIPSFKRTSRRYGEMVKGKIRNPNIDNIIIAVDTSGSIDTELHERFLNEICLIRKLFKVDIRYIQCDTDIHMDKKLKRSTDMSKIKIYGHGGTDFRPVFDLIQKKHYKPNLLLYFTDGCGDYPEKTNINTLWVLDDNDWSRNSYKPPFGNIIYMNRD
jgi:predicted metal-dependent peptidase